MPAVLRIAAAAALAVVLYGQTESSPPAPPAQPIPFSHKTHVAGGLKCRDCHPNRDPGERMGLPEVSKCMACHFSIAKDKPAIQALSEYAKNKQPIPWVRVYTLPAEVYWSHRSHLNAKVACEACHGQVSQMEAVARVTKVTTMEGCVDCHKERNVSTGCDFCHEGK
jgi:hypothetical protein